MSSESEEKGMVNPPPDRRPGWLDSPDERPMAPPDLSRPSAEERLAMMAREAPASAGTLPSKPGPAKPMNGNGRYRELRLKALDYLVRTLTSCAGGRAISLNDGYEWVAGCVQAPGDLDGLFRYAVEEPEEEPSNSLAVHLFNHTVLSLKVGAGMGWKTNRLLRLGVASMLHDIGMCRVPQHIRHKEEPLSDEEHGELRRHPAHGAAILREQFGDRYPWLVDAVYHEHERADGRGYPRGLAGGQISQYAQVIGVVDVYEALTHRRPYRERFSPYKAVHEIAAKHKDAFPPHLLDEVMERLYKPSVEDFISVEGAEAAKAPAAAGLSAPEREEGGKGRAAPGAARERAVLLDERTGLYNRLYLVNFLAGAFARARRHNIPLSAVLFQATWWSGLQEIGGSARVPLEAVRLLGQSILNRTREGDVLGLWNPDEFLLVLPHASKAGAEACAANIVSRLGNRVIWKMGGEFSARLRSGVSSYPEDDVCYAENLPLLARERLLGG